MENAYKIEILEPKGYCSGVELALQIAREARKKHKNKRIIILGMLVHNQIVTNELREEKIETIDISNASNERIEKLIPKDCVIILPAHGHKTSLDNILKKKNVIIYDAVCPRVKRNIEIIKEEIKLGHQVIYIGNKKHPETETALSINKNVILYDTKLLINYQKITNKNVVVLNQTTLNFLSLSDIHKDILSHFPQAKIYDEICNATRKRQEAVIHINKEADLIIIVGDQLSSNSKRLFEIAKISHPNTLCIMVSNEDELDEEVLYNKKYVVIASGASTPISVINNISNFVDKILKNNNR